MVIAIMELQTAQMHASAGSVNAGARTKPHRQPLLPVHGQTPVPPQQPSISIN